MTVTYGNTVLTKNSHFRADRSKRRTKFRFQKMVCYLLGIYCQMLATYIPVQLDTRLTGVCKLTNSIVYNI